MITYRWDLLVSFRALIFLETGMSASISPHSGSKGPYAATILRDLVVLEVVSH
jgi:hypothetical protein